MAKRKDGLEIECTRKDGKEKLCRAYQRDERTLRAFCMDKDGPCGSLYEKRAARAAAREVADAKRKEAEAAEKAAVYHQEYLESLKLNAKWEV